MSEEKKQCPICYEDLTIKNAVNLPCNHTQCSKCFWKWTNEQGKQSCPMCRGEYLTHKNHHLSMEINEANEHLEIAKAALVQTLRREDSLRLKIDDLTEEYTNQNNLLTGIQTLYDGKSRELEILNNKYEKRRRECLNLGLYTREGRKMRDNMLSLFYERRYKKRLDIAEKKRDGRYKKVLEELRRYHYLWKCMDDDFKKVVLNGNQLKLLGFLKSLTDGEVNISESSWMFEEDEKNHGFWVTGAQTTMKPVYADIRVDKAREEFKVNNYEKYWCWKKGKYERKIVNWKTPEDYRKASVWPSDEFTHFKKWHKRLVKALRLTKDVKTEKGHRKRNIDVEENRITRAYKSKNNIKINNENGLEDYGISMFDEPPEFAGAETRLSLGFTRENMYRLRRVVLEEGEIDEMEESEYGIDVEDEYNTTDTDSSMPELLEVMSEDEENIPQTDNEANMIRLWRSDERQEYELIEEAFYDSLVVSSFTLQE